jgi:RNA polymerase sigma factor (sigma-70 family)
MNQQSHPSTHQSVVADIYTDYRDDLYRYFLSYTHDPAQAEDMVQDLFLKVLGLDIIIGKTAKAMLLVMARNMIVDDARHRALVRKQSETVRAESSEHDYSMERSIEARDLLGIAAKTVSAMTPVRSKIYTLFRHDGYTTKEIAKELNLGVRTVENHIYQSTKTVRSVISQAM